MKVATGNIPTMPLQKLQKKQLFKCMFVDAVINSISTNHITLFLQFFSKTDQQWRQKLTF